MAHIKEPDGVDFLIQSPPLTDIERKEIGELIKKLKSQYYKPIVSKKKKIEKEVIE